MANITFVISRKKKTFFLLIALCLVLFLFLILSREAKILVTYKQLVRQKMCLYGKQNDQSQAVNCPSRGIVTSPQGGRLGNQIWETATVWAIAKKSGLSPYIPCCMKKELEKLFRPLKIPCFETIANCPVAKRDTFVDTWEEWSGSFEQNIILKPVTFLDELVVPLLDEFREEFLVKKELLGKSQEILKEASSNCSLGCVYVGVHIRRSDYFGYLLTRPK